MNHSETANEPIFVLFPLFIFFCFKMRIVRCQKNEAKMNYLGKPYD